MDIPDNRFGAEGSGLLCAYLFERGQAGRPLDAAAALEAISASTAEPPEAFVWLHFNLAHQASLRWLRQALDLPPQFYDALDHPHSTRVETTTGSLVAVINDVTMFGEDAHDVSSMSVAASTRLLVSARRTPLKSIDRLREAVRRGESFTSAIGLLAHLLRDQAEVLARAVSDAVLRVDAIEDRSLAGQTLGGRAELGTLRRSLVRLRRLLAPEPAALFRLLNHPAEWMDETDVDLMRQSAEELAAAVADCSALVERVRLLQEELLAVLNEQTNRTLFLLTVVTVSALPLTVVSGLFGMNVGGMPLANHPGAFWILLGLMVAMAVLATVIFLRRRHDI